MCAKPHRLSGDPSGCAQRRVLPNRQPDTTADVAFARACLMAYSENRGYRHISVFWSLRFPSNTY